MKIKSKISLSILLGLLSVNVAISAPTYDTFSTFTDIMSAFAGNGYVSYDIANVDTATNKFKQTNIPSSYEDFKEIIESPKTSSLELLSITEKMYDYGFFTLAALAQTKITDEEYSFYKDCLKEFYLPKVTTSKDEELLLAALYSNIVYNNQAFEAVKELSEQKSLLKKSDYANYILALGYYKSNNFKNALNSINDAISLNSKCENYKFLKIKLLSETGKRKEALRLFNSYNNKKELPYNFRKKCELLKQFILYKTEKNQWERNYALGRYYYTHNEYSKALKSLQNASLTKKQKDLTRVYGIMSRTYLKLGDDQRAKELALKTIKEDSSNKDANLTLARIACKDEQFQDAVKYYKKATKKDKLDSSNISVAEMYELNGNTNRSEKIYKKIIKNADDEWQAYYKLAMLKTGDEKKDLLKKSIKNNPFYLNSLSELIGLEIENKDYNKAQKYLKNLLYIDENYFKYYYYQGVISHNKGNNVQAVKFFEQCLKHNSDCSEARKELLELKEYI